jgi:hypothetical protein
MMLKCADEKDYGRGEGSAHEEHCNKVPHGVEFEEGEEV